MNYLRFAPCLGLIFLSGCAGKPTTYLSLAPRPPERTVIPSPGAPIAVAHVQVSPSLDRLYLTSQIAPDQLHVAGHARWAAPLHDLIQRTLAEDLAQRITGSKVLMPGDPVPPGGVRLVRINIDQFIYRNDGLVALTADWSLVAPHQRSGQIHRTAILVRSGRQVTQQAEAMSTALGDLADKIVLAPGV